MLPVESPFKTYAGADGKPLDRGYVYFGQPNLNPVTAPVTVYWDAAGTQPAAQPLRTTNGFIMRAGTPANVFFDGSYSELVQDSKGRQVFYARTSDDFSIVSAVKNFIVSLAASGGSALVGFIQAGTGAVLRSVQDRLRETVSVKDFGAVGDGVADDTLAVQRAFDTGKMVTAPDGTYKLTAPITRTSNSISLIGSGISSCIFLFTGTGQAFNFVAATNFLQAGRIALAGFTLLTPNNTAKGQAFSTYTDQGIKIKYFHGSEIGPFLVQGFSNGLEMDTCYHNNVSALSTVECFKGLLLTGGSSGNKFNGGVHASSSIDLSAGNGNNVLSGIDIEPGSRTNYLGDGNTFNAVRFERISLNIPINPWIDLGSDNTINGLLIPFDGSSIQADGSFMVKVNGKRNVIKSPAPYVHRNGFYFGINSSDNWLTVAGDYNDNANTGGVAYIASKQWVIDYGVRNRLTLVSPNGTTDTVGDISQTIIGTVPNKCPIDIASWTLSSCTAAQPGAGYIGPLGAPTSDLLVRVFTATGVDPSIDTGLLYTADGATVYSSDCWVLIPNGTGVSSLTLRSVTNNGGHTIDATATGKWIRLWQVGQPANATAVRLQLLATGAIGTQFMMALPRVGPGYASGYSPPNSTVSTAPLANFISGKYAPVWTASGGGAALGNGTLTGTYSRNGKQVTATVELTLGATSAVGTGFYEFTLPSLCRADKAANCTGSLYDASAATTYVFGGYVNPTTGKVRLLPNGIAGQSVVGAASPVVPAVSDYLTFTISYEEA